MIVIRHILAIGTSGLFYLAFLLAVKDDFALFILRSGNKNTR
jgi:hypothetical protein